MIKVVLVEDEKLLRDYTKSLIIKNPFFEVIAECGSVSELKNIIYTNSFDLMFLDIELSDGNSIDFIEHLGLLHFDVVFLTAYHEFAIKAINIGATNYLLKPVNEIELVKVMDKAIQKKINSNKTLDSQLSSQKNKIALRTLSEIEIVNISDVLYLKSEGNYTHFHLKSKRAITVSKPLKFYLDFFPNDKFIRPHQSYFVNIDYVQKYLLEGSIVMLNNDFIPVSREKKDEIKQIIMNL